MTSGCIMTKELFYESIYLYEFEANVISVEQNGDHYDVILDQTAFYPTGGGMNCDKGTINGIEVIDVSKKDGIIVHRLAKSLTEKKIIGKIDEMDRLKRSQFHVADHLVTALFEKNYPMVNTTLHMNDDIYYLDFISETELTDAMVQKVEDQANKLIFEGKNVELHMIPKSELSKYGIKDHPLYSDPVRVINIETLDDMVPCGCLHFDNLKYVQAIKMLPFEKIPKGYRVFFTAGYSMIAYLKRTIELQKKICQLTISNETTVYADLSQVISKNKELNEANDALMQKVLQTEFESLVQKKNSNHFVEFMDNSFNFADLRKLLNIVNNYEEPLVCLLQTKLDEGYQFILGKSKVSDVDLQPIFNELKEKHQVVGGGKGLSMNGKSPVNLIGMYIL